MDKNVTYYCPLFFKSTLSAHATKLTLRAYRFAVKQNMLKIWF